MNKWKLILVLAMPAGLAGCAEDPTFTQQINASAINDYLLSIPNFAPPAIPAKTEVGNAKVDIEADNSGKEFLCETRQFEETFVLDNLTLSAFNNKNATNTAALYPGSIIQLNDLREINDLNGIGAYERNPIEISSTLGDIREVQDPSQRGNVDKAIKEIENAGEAFAAQISYQVTEAYSLKQSLYTLGIDANYIGNSVSGDLELEQTVEKKSVFIKFFQVYHTVSVANPKTPAALFGAPVTFEEIESLTSGERPLGYISEVAYGRMLVGNFTYTGSEIRTSIELAAEVKKGLGSGKVEYSQDSKNKLKNTTFTVAILGGDSQEAAKVSGTGAQALESAFEFLANGGQDRSLGVPVQYKVRYLANNELFALGGSAGYAEPTCDALNNRVTIKRIVLRNFPPKRTNGDDWDPGAVAGAKRPDIYPEILLSGDLKASYANLTRTNLETGTLPIAFNSIDYVINKANFNSEFSIRLMDNDAAGNKDDAMATLKFYLSEYLRTTGNPNPEKPYPSVITVGNASYSMDLELKWEVK